MGRDRERCQHRSLGNWKSPLLLIQLLYNDTHTGEVVITFCVLDDPSQGGRRMPHSMAVERERETTREKGVHIYILLSRTRTFSILYA